MCVLFIAAVPRSVCGCADPEGQCVYAFPLKCFSRKRWRKAIRCIVKTNVLFLSFLPFHQHPVDDVTQLSFQAERQSSRIGENEGRIWRHDARIRRRNNLAEGRVRTQLHTLSVSCSKLACYFNRGYSTMCSFNVLSVECADSDLRLTADAF